MKAIIYTFTFFGAIFGSASLFYALFNESWLAFLCLMPSLCMLGLAWAFDVVEKQTAKYVG